MRAQSNTSSWENETGEPPTSQDDLPPTPYLACMHPPPPTHPPTPPPTHVDRHNQLFWRCPNVQLRPFSAPGRASRSPTSVTCPPPSLLLLLFLLLLLLPTPAPLLRLVDSPTTFPLLLFPPAAETTKAVGVHLPRPAQAHRHYEGASRKEVRALGGQGGWGGWVGGWVGRVVDWWQGRTVLMSSSFWGRGRAGEGMSGWMYRSNQSNHSSTHPPRRCGSNTMKTGTTLWPSPSLPSSFRSSRIGPRLGR